MTQFGLLLLLISTISLVECGGGTLDFGQAIQDLVKTFTTKYAVVVTNKMGNSMYLKCASADDAITGDGSDDDDWWTLEPGQALAWGFGVNNWDTTCFWCYANNNGQEARDSGNWYIHQNVWGWDGCDGAPAERDANNGVTNWEFWNSGAWSNMCNDCGENGDMVLYTSWGPEP